MQVQCCGCRHAAPHARRTRVPYASPALLSTRAHHQRSAAPPPPLLVTRAISFVGILERSPSAPRTVPGAAAALSRALIRGGLRARRKLSIFSLNYQGATSGSGSMRCAQGGRTMSHLVLYFQHSNRCTLAMTERLPHFSSITLSTCRLSQRKKGQRTYSEPSRGRRPSAT